MPALKKKRKKKKVKSQGSKECLSVNGGTD